MDWVAVAMAPEGEALDEAIVARLAGRLKAGPVRRLGPDAVEMAVAAPYAEPGEAGIDWAVLPARGRRKRLLVADMDSTMVAGETLDELAVEAGIGGRVNRLEVRDGRLTGRVLEPVLGQDAKRRALEERRNALGLAPGETLAVGDGANDLAMLAAAGLGVAFRARPAVAAEARIRVDRAGLAALLYLQGYMRAEFAA